MAKFVCEKCGKIEDIMKPEISNFAIKGLKNQFYVKRVDVIFHGFCEQCRRK